MQVLSRFQGQSLNCCDLHCMALVCVILKTANDELIPLDPIINFLNPGNYSVNRLMLNKSLQIDDALWNIGGRLDKDTESTFLRDYGNMNELDEREYINVTISSLYPLKCGTTTDYKCNPPTWTEFFNSIFAASGHPHIRTNPRQRIIIKNHEYLDELDATLEALNLQPYELANYMGWKILVDYIVATGNIQHAFGGNCINYLTKGRSNKRSQYGLLNGAVGSMYIREHFSDPKIKKQVQEMVKYIRETFKLRLPTITWMDQQTKRKASEKLNAMEEFIAYPDELLDKTTIDHYYKGMYFFNFCIGNTKKYKYEKPQNLK